MGACMVVPLINFLAGTARKMSLFRALTSYFGNIVHICIFNKYWNRDAFHWIYILRQTKALIYY